MKAIELTRGQVAIVDDEDFERLAQYRWHCTRDGYAARSGSLKDGTRTSTGNKIRMHNEVLKVPTGMLADHINGNKLDNRRCNLRAATPAQNSWNMKASKQNKLGIRGVFYHAHSGNHKKYRAVIKHNGKNCWLGRFATAEEAKAAYQATELRLRGEFSSTHSRS